MSRTTTLADLHAYSGATSVERLAQRFEEHSDRYPGLMYVLVEWPEGGWDAKPVPEAFDSLFSGMPLRKLLHQSIEDVRKTEPDPLPRKYQFVKMELDTYSWCRDCPGGRVVPGIGSLEWFKRPTGKTWAMTDCKERVDVLSSNACREFADNPTLAALTATLGPSKAWIRTVQLLVNPQPQRRWWEWHGGTSYTVAASGDITRPVFSFILDTFDASAQVVRHLIEHRGEPDEDAHDAVIGDLVTLAQVAPLTGLSKRTLERYKLPKPDEQGGGGRAHKWYYKRLRSALEKRSKRPLPKTFPASRFRSSCGA